MGAAMANAAEKRIALFGGSFDPPHTGHLAIAQDAVEKCGLNQVIFIPCRESPLKGKLPGAPADQRLEMLRLAVAGLPWAQVSDWELLQPGPSYSWQTVEHFAAEYPGARLYWLMGFDQWADIERWARPEFLREHITLIVFPRDGLPPVARKGWQTVFLPGEYEGSSTEVRRLIAAGESADRMLLPAVQDYILKAGLYKQGDRR
jgi:nicotinate-nucleotide adenylyltransferase